MAAHEQLLDTIGIDDTSAYMHHYNMAPFASGWQTAHAGPKRREIGSTVCWPSCALLPVVPPRRGIPLYIRCGSSPRCFLSNGRRRCLGVLLVDVAGWTRVCRSRPRLGGDRDGSRLRRGKYTTLTDIWVPGSIRRHGLQSRRDVTLSPPCSSDTKSMELPSEVLAQALSRRATPRNIILDVMDKAIDRAGDRRQAHATEDHEL